MRDRGTSTIEPTGAASRDGFAQVVFLDELDVDIDRIGAALRAGSVVVITPAPLPLGDRLQPTTEVPGIEFRPQVFLQVDELRIDLGAHRAQWRGRTLDFTEHELLILAALARHPGRAFSFNDLFEEVWHANAYGHHDAVRSAVKRLRLKLRAAGVTVKLESVKGFGYRLA